MLKELSCGMAGDGNASPGKNHMPMTVPYKAASPWPQTFRPLAALHVRADVQADAAVVVLTGHSETAFQFPPASQHAFGILVDRDVAEVKLNTWSRLGWELVECACQVASSTEVECLGEVEGLRFPSLRTVTTATRTRHRSRHRDVRQWVGSRIVGRIQPVGDSDNGKRPNSRQSHKKDPSTLRGVGCRDGP